MRKILKILNITKCNYEKKTLLCHEVVLGSSNKDCSYQITGHWIAEEQPNVLAKLLNNFFRGNSTTTSE
jgi:hypothetical protein